MTGMSDAFEKALMAGCIGNRLISAHQGTARRYSSLLTAGLCSVGILLSTLALLRYLETICNPSTAAFFTALIVFGAAAVAYFVSIQLSAYKIRHIKKSTTIFEQELKELIEIISSTLSDPVKNNPKTALLIAALAGFLVARTKL